MENMKEKIVKINCLELEASLNRAFFTKNTVFSTTRLLFLKYITDNFVGAMTKEDFQYYALVQKMFAARDVEGGPNALYPILAIVDKYYHFDRIIEDSINEYAKELFGLDASWNRKSASLYEFKAIMHALAEIDLTEDNDKTIGKGLVKELIAQLQQRNLGNRMFSEYISRLEVGELASKILQVQENEHFFDFAAGIGTTTLSIIGDKNCAITNYDLNRESLSVLAMFCVMSGYKNINIKCVDSFRDYVEPVVADKIFVDAPIGLKIEDSLTLQKKESTIMAIEKTISSLSDKGLGIVTVNSGLLFGTGKVQKEAKKMLIENSYLKSVIALPISFFGTVVSINLLVVSKEKNQNIIFVNAGSKAFSKHLTRLNSKETTISQEGIDLIADIVNNEKAVEEISTIISNDKIVEKGYDLMPTTYVKEKIAEESITIEEIDSELEKLYTQLGIK